jgi:hypothetical protein
MFYQKDVVVQLSVTLANLHPDHRVYLADLLTRIDASDYDSMTFMVSDLKTIEPLHLENAGEYAGTLGCRFRISGIIENDTFLLNESLTRVKIKTTRTRKSFGTEKSMLVWQAFLVEVVAEN